MQWLECWTRNLGEPDSSAHHPWNVVGDRLPVTLWQPDRPHRVVGEILDLSIVSSTGHDILPPWALPPGFWSKKAHTFSLSIASGVPPSLFSLYFWPRILVSIKCRWRIAMYLEFTRRKMKYKCNLERKKDTFENVWRTDDDPSHSILALFTGNAYPRWLTLFRHQRM